MENREVLEKVQDKKASVVDVEKAKINKACWIATIVSCAIAVVLMVVEGVLGNFTSLYALASICFMWASVFYFCQYFLAKKSWQVLIGAVLESMGAITMMVLFILFSAGIL